MEEPQAGDHAPVPPFAAESANENAPRRIVDLSHLDRRRALIRTGITVVASWVILIGVYYAFPIVKHPGLSVILRMVAGLALVAVVIWWQLQRILRADLPELRAAEALAVVVPLFLLVYSMIYLSMSHALPHSFSNRLDHTRALYFTITVFSTVGFGDITPRTDNARIIVSLQMLVDLVIIGVVVRLLFNAARSGLGRGPRNSTPGATDPPSPEISAGQ
jgi:hypothetical protein